eukprot:gi/632975578/ref/XP_007904306.1/ PREDICTED: putative sodium-coupled neutral amino acid transporter 10 isoform X1 [Callorhinchus milii]
MAYGKTGKLAVELSVIGLMLGTSMAFFAVINELGANLVQVVSGSSLLARCLDTVSSGRLATPQIRLWHWSGITTCLPIFGSMFICQPQVLPMYFSLKERSVERMELAFKQAITISCTFYTIVGLCGYIPLPQTVPGNILATLPSTTAIDYVRLMFLFSMVMSFPLVVLPCRQAINTLLFEQQREDGTFSVSGDMPRQRHVIVTVLVVFSTMTVGALVQDVETVFGVIGTTAGSIISLICPPIIHAKLHRYTSAGRVILGVGIFLLLIRVSSVTVLEGVEIHGKPVRKSITSDVLTHNHTKHSVREQVLPVLVSNDEGRQMRPNEGGPTYKQGEKKEPSHTVTGDSETAMLREAGLATSPSKGENLRKPRTTLLSDRMTGTKLDRVLEEERSYGQGVKEKCDDINESSSNEGLQPTEAG